MNKLIKLKEAIPVLEKNEAGQLTGGFIDMTCNNDTEESLQSNNGECSNNRTCVSNQTCRNNDLCYYNHSCNTRCGSSSIGLSKCESKPIG